MDVFRVVPAWSRCWRINIIQNPHKTQIGCLIHVWPGGVCRSLLTFSGISLLLCLLPVRNGWFWRSRMIPEHRLHPEVRAFFTNKTISTPTFPEFWCCSSMHFHTTGWSIISCCNLHRLEELKVRLAARPWQNRRNSNIFGGDAAASAQDLWTFKGASALTEP